MEVFIEVFFFFSSADRKFLFIKFFQNNIFRNVRGDDLAAVTDAGAKLKTPNVW